MEQINRLISFYKKNNLIKCSCFDRLSFIKSFVYRMDVVLNEDETNIDSFYDLTEEFCLKNSIFSFIRKLDKQILLVDDSLVTVSINIVDYLNKDFVYKDNTYNPKNLKVISYDDKNSLLMADILSNMFIKMNEFIIHYKEEDFILAFSDLSIIDSYIINFLFLFHLNKPNGTLIELYQEMGKKKSVEFRNYHSVFCLNTLIESAKMIVWFINDYLIEIPVGIMSLINIDFYYNLKRNIVGI